MTAPVINVAMIGLDTSHCEAFADLLNNSGNPYHVPGCRVVRAFPGGSEAFSHSRNRVARFTDTIRDKFNIAIVDSIDEAMTGADAVILHSVDGRQHLEQFRAIAPYGVPVFIDKPLACTVADALAIFELAKTHNAPVYTCSSIRYAAGIAGLGAGAVIHGGEASGPMALLDDYPASFWYGIHSAEVLYSKLGVGCASVRTVHTAQADLLIGTWKDGRLGVVRGLRVDKGAVFACALQTSEGPVFSPALPTPPYYATMMPAIVEFFRTRQSPIPDAESIEIIAFLDAADRSRVSGQDEPLFA